MTGTVFACAMEVLLTELMTKQELIEAAYQLTGGTFPTYPLGRLIA